MFSAQLNAKAKECHRHLTTKQRDFLEQCVRAYVEEGTQRFHMSGLKRMYSTPRHAANACKHLVRLGFFKLVTDASMVIELNTDILIFESTPTLARYTET